MAGKSYYYQGVEFENEHILTQVKKVINTMEKTGDFELNSRIVLLIKLYLEHSITKDELKILQTSYEKAKEQAKKLKEVEAKHPKGDQSTEEVEPIEKTSSSNESAEVSSFSIDPEKRYLLELSKRGFLILD